MPDPGHNPDLHGNVPDSSTLALVIVDVLNAFDFPGGDELCTREGVPGRPLGRLLAPAPEDYVVLKPKHSGFYSTTLDTVLTYLGCKRRVLGADTTASTSIDLERLRDEARASSEGSGA